MASPITIVSARLVVYALFLTALFACNGNTPLTPPASAPTKPNASSSTVTVETAEGNRLQDAIVTLSSALNGTTPSGTIIGTQPTGFTGQAVFDGLPSSGEICVSAADRGYVTAGTCRQPFPSTFTLKLSP